MTAIHKYEAITEAVKRSWPISGAKEKKGQGKFTAKKKPWRDEKYEKVVEDRSRALRTLLNDISLPNLIEKS